jgi:hypothetical protein
MHAALMLMVLVTGRSRRGRRLAAAWPYRRRAEGSRGLGSDRTRHCARHAFAGRLEGGVSRSPADRTCLPFLLYPLPILGSPPLPISVHNYPQIHWALTEQWTSPLGRIALIGDAAHPFLPTSIQGASQSMEDGATLAVTLQLAGKAHVAEALRGYQRIRYDRVRRAQKTGETTRDRWHKADFSTSQVDPDKMKLVRESWLLDFDAEQHAYEVWERTLAEMRAEEAEGRGKGEDG